MNSVAPVIAGHRHLRLISAEGGYGDVHLYEETALGNRRVAVKIIRDADIGSEGIRQFLAEAQAMAALEHPNIVRVYRTGNTSDGRPFISMQYCPDDTLERRVAREPLSVAEALQVGIGIGSAVETAHRSGLLHRDIKPANILTTPWGAPGLTDFGVAHQMAAEESAGDVGVSVPWSPPEMLYTSTNGGPASDVYSLAATLWHLLVGRPPFEVPGGDNSTFATMSRIRDLPSPPTGRPEVTEPLERVLRQAMAKRPEHRPRTMAEFIGNLQAVQADLRYPVTDAVIIDTAARLDLDERHPRPGQEPPGQEPSGQQPSGQQPSDQQPWSQAVSDGSGTVLRARTAGSPERTPAPAPPHRTPRNAPHGSSAAGGPDLQTARTQLRAPTVADRSSPGRSSGGSLGGSSGSASGGSPSPVGSGVHPDVGTVIRPRTVEVEVPRGRDPEPTARRRTLLITVGIGFVLIAAVVGYLLAGRGSGGGTPMDRPTTAATQEAGAVEDSLPPGPVRITGTRDGDLVTFTWEYSARVDTDEFRWRVVGGESGVASSPTTTVRAPSPDQVCLEVIVVRLDGSNATTEWSKPGCA